MKIAGRKNDGAWFRMNKVIKVLDADERTALGAKIVACPHFPEAYNVLTELANEAGMTSGTSGVPATSDDWLQILVTTGIPRQCWFGVLSYDTYTRAGAPGSYTYTQDHQEDWFAFGKELRKACKEFIFARRQALDLSNVISRQFGNPGGIANAEEGD
jgi:hypothetical protein